MKRKSENGFSLVELLVVIGIIAALIAILLPALNTAREHAKRIVCLSNIRQLNIAWINYAIEHKGHFCSSETQSAIAPDSGNYYIGNNVVPKSPHFWSWIAYDDGQDEIAKGLLWPYLKDLRVYSCPDNPMLPNTSYAINGVLAGRVPIQGGTIASPVPGATLLTLSQLRHPESTFVLIEAMQHLDDGDGDFDGDDLGAFNRPCDSSFYTPVYPNRLSQCPGLFHKLGNSMGTTIAFADGHAIFWEYAAMPTGEFATAQIKLPAPDITQLQAWSGGPTPPGATP